MWGGLRGAGGGFQLELEGVLQRLKKTAEPVHLQGILEKAGKLNVLGSLEDNDPDAADEEHVDQDEEEAGQEDDGGLADKLASTHIE